MAFRNFAIARSLPAVSNSYTRGNLHIAAKSDISFDGKYYVAAYSVVVASKSPDVQIVAPGMITLEKYIPDWEEFTLAYL